MRIPILLLSTALTTYSFAENWPMWRGPRLDGTSQDKGFPEKWDSSTLAWKAELPGGGHASPIVWNDRIFTVASVEDSGARVLISIDRASGKVLWQTPVVTSPLEKKHGLNSHASSTPATDGEKIYTAFLDLSKTKDEPQVGSGRKNDGGTASPGEPVVSAHDFNGKLVWQKRIGRFSSKHGFCSSPVLYKDKVIVNCDHDGDGYIVALARTDGRELWRIERPNKTRSYVVPIIREIAGKTQMVLSGTICVTSYNPDDGKLIWSMDGPTEQFVASLVHSERTGWFYLTGGFPEHHVMAIKPDGSGKLGDDFVPWHTNKGAAYVPSPIIEGDWFLITSDSGIAHCFEAKTGRIAWTERFGEQHASLVSAEGKVWFVNDRGLTRAVKPGDQYALSAESDVGEKVFASPAMSDGQVFVRGDKSLLCFGKRTAQSRTASK